MLGSKEYVPLAVHHGQVEGSERETDAYDHILAGICIDE